MLFCKPIVIQKDTEMDRNFGTDAHLAPNPMGVNAGFSSKIHEIKRLRDRVITSMSRFSVMEEVRLQVNLRVY